MVSIDFIGLIITTIAISLRYPHYGIAAMVIHEFGRIAMAVFLQSDVQMLTAAGVFSSATVTATSVVTTLLISFSGPLANFIIGSITGGVGLEQTRKVFDPRSRLNNPFAVVNLRLALFSCLFNIGAIL
ncbi:hypothetical protein [Dendrosporobacter sp. 1207_IL3150]|uniref:hypothetical protein n=1 Tax=Dendrosporobacter sp. 1207_IL3150 TaxID=3084054 RepID=UPI002FDADC1D